MWSDLAQWFNGIFGAGESELASVLQWAWSLIVGMVGWVFDPAHMMDAGYKFSQGVQAVLTDVLPASCDAAITSFFSAVEGPGPSAACRLALYIVDHFCAAGVVCAAIVALLLSLPAALCVRTTIYVIEHVWSGAGA